MANPAQRDDDLSQRWRRLVAGQSRGVVPALLRGALRVAAAPYSAAMRMRNWRYNTGRAAVEHVSASVISVGNLTLGGTGKTPMVEWLARFARARNLQTAIVSRGYGAEAGARNDEALELEQRLPDVPHLQNVDRVAAARAAVDELEAQVIVLDDGFQHRRLARDLDLVLLDAVEPFGYGYVFPRGMLREPVAGLSRAHAVVLSRADMIDASARQAIRQRVKLLTPDAVWAEAVHAPQRWLASSGATQPLDALRDRPVVGFCGIGNPAGFQHTLERCGCRLVDFRIFPDHHAYARADVEELSAWGRQCQAAAVVCTHKDLVKVGVDRLGDIPLWALLIGLEMTTGQADLEEEIAAILPVELPGHDEMNSPSS